MSIAHGKVEFDEKNIINFKGYNDSGKSAMLTALKVLLANTNPTKQVMFIQDDKDYFRILATFSDGIQILRDKYINGQSLYEMYKDGQCIYTTKSGKALSRITEVPQPIADYLGMIMYDGVCLNARACFEKQIGVQTTGSENYKMFNTVLKSEVIATASELLNNDKNKLSADINATDMDLQSQKAFLGDKKNLTGEMITYLKDHDSLLDTYIESLVVLNNISSITNQMNTIPSIPELALIDCSQLSLLESIAALNNEIKSVIGPPALSDISNSELLDLEKILSLKSSIEALKVAPEVSEISTEQLSDLQVIQNIFNQLNETSKSIDEAEDTLIDYETELISLQTELSAHGVKMIKCPGCGILFSTDEEHSH